MFQPASASRSFILARIAARAVTLESLRQRNPIVQFE